MLKTIKHMKPLVRIIMGSTSDWPIMKKAANLFEEMEIPFEANALSAHRTPEKVEQFAKNASHNGIRIIIAGAGMAAHLPGVIAAMTPIPVIGVPIKASLDGLDSLLATLQMPKGVPVATMTVGKAGFINAAILCAEIFSIQDNSVSEKLSQFKDNGAKL